MGRVTKIGEPMPRPVKGFTLIELVMVLFMVALLASLAAPVVTGTIQRARESSLREDLYVMRKAIDDFFADNGRYPEKLEDLVEKRYMRKLPVDPLTEHAHSWIEVRDEQAQGGNIIDVRSGADGKDAEGVFYRDW